MLRYLKFLIRSTNQHGIHSPFVYVYVTRGLYRGRKYKGPKHRRILFRTMAYFKSKSIHIADLSDNNLCDALRKYFPGISVKPEGVSDISCYNKPLRPDEVSRFLNETIFKDDHILVLEKIHETPASEDAWQIVKKNTKVTVTVDLFYLGLVFFRKGQVREDFVIRP
ncbi:hypothetical protein [Sinomicrobium weinanense]|uniref:Uncharacterized protein n=1 Tax=Sinomicrobium weinanense TaxID=2842200 RepID=A0A926JVX7_9FLAO|nr:hypothetical protein [Sinomicrobium weinanense]MBC9798168.1 hypothetical protein [Sinomicrobium weinanense]MBU3122132.1 hypothetical protein [Sinomicrobium weinanense]